MRSLRYVAATPSVCGIAYARRESINATASSHSSQASCSPTFGALIVFATLGFNLGPGYYLLMLTAFAPAVVYATLRRAVRRAVVRREVAERWKARGPGIHRVRYTRLHALQETYLSRTARPERGYVDDRTWADLNMDKILEEMDVAFTIAGRNELLWTLRHSLPDADPASLL